MKKNALVAITTAAILLAPNVNANAEWQFGIGTGIGITNYDGDLTFEDGNKLDVEYDQNDFEGGFGLAGFATDGTWVINLSASMVEYESKDTIQAETERSKNNFEQTGAELTLGYVAYREGAITLTPYAGIQYTDHEWSFKSSSEKVDIGDSWVDGVIGLKLDYKINEEWAWNNYINYAAGDSEGCLGIQTGVSWQWTESWIAGAYVSFESDEFDGEDGNAEFDYDTDVTKLGLTIAYIW